MGNDNVMSPDGKWIWTGDDWLLANCAKCDNSIELEWNVCPFCSHELTNNINDNISLKIKGNSTNSSKPPKTHAKKRKKQTQLQKHSYSNYPYRIDYAVMVIIVILSVILFDEDGFFRISLVDWLFTNCNDFANDFSLSGTSLYQGDDFFDDIYNQCSDRKDSALFFTLSLGFAILFLVVRFIIFDKDNTEQLDESE